LSVGIDFKISDGLLFGLLIAEVNRVSALGFVVLGVLPRTLGTKPGGTTLKGVAGRLLQRGEMPENSILPDIYTFILRSDRGVAVASTSGGGSISRRSRHSRF